MYFGINLRYNVAWRQDMYCLMEDGTKIYYQICGRGYPIVFLHGNGLSGKYFKKQVRELAGEYCCICIDSRAQGNSNNEAEELEFAQMAKDVEEVLCFLRIKKCLIVGHSDGANLALVYARDYPDRVGGMLINSPNIQINGVKKYGVWLVDIEYALLCFLGKRFLFAKKMAKVVHLMVEDVPISYEELKKIKVPVYVLGGSRDIIKREHMKNIASHLGNGKLLIRRGQGHHIALFDTRVYNRLVSYIVKKIKGGEQ